MAHSRILSKIKCCKPMNGCQLLCCIGESAGTLLNVLKHAQAVVCKRGFQHTISAHFQNGSKFFKVSPGNPLFILMTSLSVSLTPLPVASRNLITLPGISAHFKNGSKCRRGITRQTFQNIPEHFSNSKHS